LKLMTALAALLTIYIAAVLETTLATHWRIAGTGPDLLALVAFAWLAIRPGASSLVLAAAAGLVVDLGSATPMGIATAAFALSGYAALRLRNWINLDHFAGRLASVLLATTISCLIQGLAARLVGEMSLTWLAVFQRSVIVGLYTTAAAVPVLMILNWLSRPQRPYELSSVAATQ